MGIKYVTKWKPKEKPKKESVQGNGIPSSKKTKSQFLNRLYTKMKSRINGTHGHNDHLYAGKEIMPLSEFLEWAILDDDFNTLWDGWKESGCQKAVVPSIDRIDSDFGYIPGNVRFITFTENCRNIKR